MYRSLLKLWRHLALKKSAQIQVMRMVNDKFLIGVTGVIFNADRQVLVVKHSYRRVPWSLPGGFLQAGEHPKNGLEREIYEETRFKVRVEKIIKTKHDEDTARLDMCYVGTYLTGEFRKSHEVSDFGFFSRDKLPPLINDQYRQIDLAYKRYDQLHSQPFLKKIASVFTSLKMIFIKR
jgi:ADP-ribose pyrophosphatase YjhB (NUDIX family)